MQIDVNGRPQEVASDTTIATLLERLGLEARHVAVGVNLQLVPRSMHLQHRLVEGDKLEVVTLVGGG